MSETTGGCAAVLAAVFAAVLAAMPAASHAAEPPPAGDYVVVAVRPAAGAPAQRADPSLKGVRAGAKVRFGAEIVWLSGRRCKSWSVSESPKPVIAVTDPGLSDTQVTAANMDRNRPDHRKNRHLTLACDGKQAGGFLQVDDMVLVAPSPGGQSHVILERQIPRAAARRIEYELIQMKFMSGRASGRLAGNAQRGAGYFAGFLGAAKTFRASPLTENMVEAMGLHDLLPKPRPAKPALDLIRTIAAGAVSAHFMGRRDPVAPPTYQVKRLVFTFKGDPRRYPFRPRGQLYFSDWYFDGLFSPDARHVLLLQNRFGPYHVVRTDHLKGYLTGRREPDAIVGSVVKDRPAAVHSDARWLSSKQISYVTTCCGSSQEHRYTLGDEK